MPNDDEGLDPARDPAFDPDCEITAAASRDPEVKVPLEACVGEYKMAVLGRRVWIMVLCTKCV